MRASISLWSGDVRSIDDLLVRVGAVADCFHIDVVAHEHARSPVLGAALIAALRARTRAAIEVHLLVPDPADWIDIAVAAGASTIIVPSRAGTPRPLLERIRAANRVAALSLDVNDDIDVAMEHFDLIDQIILMGTTPEFRGADLHEQIPGRVRALVDARRLNDETATEPIIFVEGAVREHTLDPLAAAGCDGVVVGALVLASADPGSVIGRIAALSPRHSPLRTS